MRGWGASTRFPPDHRRDHADPRGKGDGRARGGRLEGSKLWLPRGSKASIKKYLALTMGINPISKSKVGFRAQVTSRIVGGLLESGSR